MLPKFRSLEEVNRWIREQQDEVAAISSIAEQQIKLLSKRVLAYEVIDITGDPTLLKQQKKRARKSLVIDTTFPTVKVPNVRELTKKYKILEELHTKYLTVEEAVASITLEFSNRRGDQVEKTIGDLTKLKASVEKVMRELFDAISKVAHAHAPEKFKLYVEAIAEELEKTLQYKSSTSALYVAPEETGKLVFVAYLILQNVVNDEDEEAPTLYIAIKWIVGGAVTIHVDHEFTMPARLSNGVAVASLHDAARAINRLLAIEGFAAQIGTLPVSMKLKHPMRDLTKDNFILKEFISKIVVDKNMISFDLVKGLTSNQYEGVKDQIFYDLKTHLKVTTMREKSNLKVIKKPRITLLPVKGVRLTFRIGDVAGAAQLDTEDFEFLADKFGLSHSDLLKVTNVINNG